MSSVSVVNGYVCFSKCDEKQAKQGKDPNAPPGASQDVHAHKSKGLNGQPATVLDGLLKDLASAVTPADHASSADNNSQPSQRVDLLA